MVAKMFFYERSKTKMKEKRSVTLMAIRMGIDDRIICPYDGQG
jgi:hypothetical protein